MTPFLLQHLLLESTLKYPDNIAFRYEDQSITYRQLETKSSRLANMLRNKGVKPGDPVGIYLTKSLEAIVSFFAVLKAGAVYIPLDSMYSPPERIAGIIKLSDARHMITHEQLWHTLKNDLKNHGQNLESLTVVLTDNLLGGTHTDRQGSTDVRLIHYDDSFDDNPPDIQGMTDMDLAYILYTSGSTGKPKGVMISHVNALTFINWALDCFKPQEGDVFANHAPLNFDLSVFDIYVSVASGACTCLVPFHKASNPRALIQWISENKISYWYSVPQVWITILNYASIEKEKLSHLSHILFAGEVFPTVYLKKLMGLLPEASYYNLYGPTETNVCTFYHVKDKESLGLRPVPIGRACSNYQIIVLNDHDQPVAEGEEGELHVRGSGVTSGYYKDPERTNAVFKKSPLASHHGAFLYKTGDIVVKREQNTYEYVGRKDFMVKCSGFRIELPEVEHALFQYEAIEEAVVVAHSDKEMGNSRLHAFVTSKPGNDLSIIQLKKHLTTILPRYMVPDIIEQVQEIPKNSNGKTDRQTIKGWL
ncbi:MAG: amino acid adenylation domain-containing protein [Proteobacteria bacterium]|nr:amino acid adenylation domain-containing protein [Pseudomonadota bacterium]